MFQVGILQHKKCLQLKAAKVEEVVNISQIKVWSLTKAVMSLAALALASCVKNNIFSKFK